MSEVRKKFSGARLFITAVVALVLAATTAGCSTESDTVSYNLSQDAEQFNIERRIVFYNGITDSYMLTVEGLCSVDPAEGLSHALAVTCKTGPKEYKKHYLGLSDNVTYFVEQTQASESDPYHYSVIFKPESVIPDITLDTSTS